MLQSTRMKLVSNQLGPNFTLRDALVAVSYSLIPWTKEKSFEHLFCTKNYILASTARTLLGSLAKQLKKGKKIGIPAVCCAVMATPFLEEGFDIQWLDTDEHGLIDTKEVKKYATELALVIVPHTFGQRAKIEEILKIAKQNDIITIEDCAHLFLTGEPIADYRLLSFGREKDVSCVSGGALTWRKDSPYAKFFTTHYLAKPNRSWVIRHAIQPLILTLSMHWWFKGGRFIAAFFSKSGIMPRAVSKAEKSGHEDFPRTRLGITQQHILARAIGQHNKELKRRKKLAEEWGKVLTKKFPDAKLTYPENLFRVIITGVIRTELLKKAQSIGFNLREWDGAPIAPTGVDLKKFGYQTGECPKAEIFIKNYLTFPTNRCTEISDIKRFAQNYKK